MKYLATTCTNVITGKINKKGKCALLFVDKPLTKAQFARKYEGHLCKVMYDEQGKDINIFVVDKENIKKFFKKVKRFFLFIYKENFFLSPKELSRNTEYITLLCFE